MRYASGSRVASRRECQPSMLPPLGSGAGGPSRASLWRSLGTAAGRSSSLALSCPGERQAQPGICRLARGSECCANRSAIPDVPACPCMWRPPRGRTRRSKTRCAPRAWLAMPPYGSYRSARTTSHLVLALGGSAPPREPPRSLVGHGVIRPSDARRCMRRGRRCARERASRP